MKKKGIIIASTGSGTGKTTLTLAIAGALRRRGVKVAPFKCGPDYLDPTYLSRVTGRECENLDPWMMGKSALEEVFYSAMEGADFALIEGVMGLFDGVAGREEGSTAHVAALLGLPVVLVIDTSGMSATAGAIFHGLRELRKDINITALICNRVAGKPHRRMLEDAVGGDFFLGAIPRMEECLTFKSRHLGLLRADRRALTDETIEALTELAEAHVDVARLLELAAPLRCEKGWTPCATGDEYSVRIAIAKDEAFHFYYPYNLKLLKAFGAELVEFSPLKDRGLPEGVDGLYIGGGYPECFAEELSENKSMLQAIREASLSGMPVYGECGGLMYLTEGVRLTDGRFFPMAGVLEAECVMHKRLKALGYVEVETTEDSIAGPSGTHMRGHQFRYSELVPKGRIHRVYRVRTVRTGELTEEGYRACNLLASYVHVHWAYSKDVPENFVKTCQSYRRRRCHG